MADNELSTGGIRVHSKHQAAYPEVTGYIVPTLLDYGENEFAGRLIDWLVSIQLEDGSFADPDHGKAHVFDTAQILRGLVALFHRSSDVQESTKRATNYLVSQLESNANSGYPNQYGGDISETILLYTLEPLKNAADTLNCPKSLKWFHRSLEHYLHSPSLTDSNRLTHFLAYELEALIDLGFSDRATPILDQLEQEQKTDGAIRGVGNAHWVCSTGLAQLAICWYKLGRRRPADLAMNWLDNKQNESGGFFGSYGKGARYFPDREISWAAKYYLDGDRLRRKTQPPEIRGG